MVTYHDAIYSRLRSRCRCMRICRCSYDTSENNSITRYRWKRYLVQYCINLSSRPEVVDLRENMWTSCGSECAYYNRTCVQSLNIHVIQVFGSSFASQMLRLLQVKTVTNHHCSYHIFVQYPPLLEMDQNRQSQHPKENRRQPPDSVDTLSGKDRYSNNTQLD